MVNNSLLLLFIGIVWNQEENITWTDIKLIQIETTMFTIDNPIITSISDSTLALLRGDILPYSSLNSLTTYGKVNPILPIPWILSLWSCSGLMDWIGISFLNNW